jgi:hypothetical protein
VPERIACRLAGAGKIVGRLQIHPQLRIPAEKPLETQREVGGNCLAAAQDFVEVRARDFEARGNLFFVFPVAGITTSRSNSPGCIGGSALLIARLLM